MISLGAAWATCCLPWTGTPAPGPCWAPRKAASLASLSSSSPAWQPCCLWPRRQHWAQLGQGKGCRSPPGPSTAARVMPAGFSTTWCRFLAAPALLPCAAHPAPPPCGRAVQLQALTTFTLCHSVLVGEGLCQGVPRAEPGPEALRHYGEGVQMGSLGRLLQCAVSLSVFPPSWTGWSSHSAPGQSVSPVWWLSLGCWPGSQLLLLPPRGGTVNSCR